jgi:hypothetical protein
MTRIEQLAGDLHRGKRQSSRAAATRGAILIHLREDVPRLSWKEIKKLFGFSTVDSARKAYLDAKERKRKLAQLEAISQRHSNMMRPIKELQAELLTIFRTN